VLHIIEEEEEVWHDWIRGDSGDNLGGIFFCRLDEVRT